MGKLTLFQITISKGVFQAGETLQGHVTLELKEEMTMRGIRLRFMGAANVHWSERHSHGSGKNRRTTTRHYRSSETYFDYTLVLFGKAPGASGDNPVHPPGRVTYPFHYQLPPNLPSSFEGEWGRVRYSLQCNIDRPWKFDHNCKAAFTVLSILDLNLQPDVLQPKQGESSKTLCCLCCESGPISAKFWIDRNGYVPGEYITLNGEVDNKSNRTMGHSKISLQMVTTFHATSKSRSASRELVNITKGEIEPGNTEVWSGMRLQIPPLPPSALVYCNIIDIRYYVSMTVSPNGPAFNLDVPLEVVIGTIPLRNVYAAWTDNVTAPPMINMPAPVHNQPTAPPGESQPTAPPPPSYAECVTGKVDIREEEDNEYVRGDLNWAPQYTYYTYGNTDQAQN